MEKLVDGLSQMPDGKIIVYLKSGNNQDGNEMTAQQVAKANEKGWKVFYLDEDDGETYAYEGMKNNILIDEINFPDEHFRDYLLAQSYGNDGELSEEEIAEIKELDLSEMKIYTLKGIEHFTELENLNCCENELTELDVSKNKKLIILQCTENKLTKLDLSQNTELETLHCNVNSLTELNVSKCNKLKKLNCYQNSLTNIDLTNCPDLQFLYCYKNSLQKLDVTHNTKLEDLYCYENQIEELNLVNNTDIIELFCAKNKLSDLDCSAMKFLVNLSCRENNLSHLNLSANTKLKYLWCEKNNLQSIDISGNEDLVLIDCGSNKLQGEQMDMLISNLPQNISGDQYYFQVFKEKDSNEGNVCTTTQVQAVKDKGWTPMYHNGYVWKDYEGSEPNLIYQPEAFDGNTGNSMRYNLSGQPVGSDYKGIVIENKKKRIRK